MNGAEEPPRTPSGAGDEARTAVASGDFPIVGIGASAGGLGAFEEFLSGMPDEDPGMAFVLVQHLAPDHKSILSDLLSRRTRMRVFEVEDGVTVAPNCAYIIPPNRDLTLRGGALHLGEPSAPRGQRLPIDSFFRSLAEDQRARAVGIVLSGTGSDGAVGVRAIKAEGGVVMAQSPDSAEHDGMPRSAIATGVVDFVLPPAAMMQQLLALARHARSVPRLAAATTGEADDEALLSLFVMLRAQTSHDFSQYKRNTILRRVERRMAVHQVARIDDYARFCQRNPAEVTALFRDLLIGVTQFFRDPEVFEVVAAQAVSQIIEAKAPGSAVRVWVPGCSTGEEAYSIAMLFQERLDAQKKGLKVQMFATDIDGHAIDVARGGAYPASIADDVSAERLARFFVRDADGGTYRVQKSLRDALVFSEHDVIKDPPFSRLDLISCRNLLIYLGAELQRRLIPLFHYALCAGGYLLLGTSESVGEFADLFAVVDRESKLYQNRDAHRAAHLAHKGAFALPLPAPAPRVEGKAAGEVKAPLREVTERALLHHITAAAVLVTARGDILYLHGRTGRYLEPAPGEASMNALKMAREGLRPALTSSLYKASTQREPVSVAGLRVKTNGAFTDVDLTVLQVAPGAAGTDDPRLFVVVLEDAVARREEGGSATSEAASTDARVAALQRELQAKEEYLRSSIEELETSNEELKSANEEMQSVNEELQSANEELETSKEELQSVNEELATVNGELQSKLADLARAGNDMSNLLASTDIGTIFVDHRLVIQRFTPSVTQVINLIATDVGRPVGHIVSNLVGYRTLVDDVNAVLDSLVPREIEVQTLAGRWFLLRIRPYRTVENVIEGAVITFVDITELKRTQALAREGLALRQLAAVVRDASDAIVMVDATGRVLAWNPAAVRMYGWREDEAVTRNIRELTPASLGADALAVAERMSRAETLAPCEAQRLARDGSVVSVWLTATALKNERGETYAFVTTERVRAAAVDDAAKERVG